jgi:subtilisin family serine protease
MSTVNVNSASPWQLAVLLDISRQEVEALLLNRPFPTADAYWQALPSRLAATRPALDIPKRDINGATVEDLIKASGVTRNVATTIVNGRPYYFPRQLAALAGTDTFALLDPYFEPPQLQFVDKLTQQPVTLTADPTRVLVVKSDTESANDTISRLHLHPAYPKATKSPFTVFNLPDTEDATDSIGQLERSHPGKLIPGFRDHRASQRFLHPSFSVVQFLATVPVADQESIIAGLGLTIVERQRTPGLYTVDFPAAKTDPAALTRVIDSLNARPEVKFAEPNFLGFDDLESTVAPVAPAGASTIGASGIAWNLAMVRVPDAWATGQGSPDVILAVVDTGVQFDHPALTGGILPRAADDNWNFTDEGSQIPADDDGHGTFIAGLLIGNGALGVQGICPGCRLLPLRVPLEGEPTSYARRRDAILYALDRVPAGSRLAMNISWKTTGDVGLIRDALATAAARGAVIGASAGNLPDEPNEVHYPSDYPSVISVAAVGPTKRRASYTYFGDSIALSAPGGDVPDALNSIASAGLGGTTTKGMGTSFAAPHVVGIAALLLSNVPSVAPDQIRPILESTASPLADQGMGKGLVDANAALQRALSTIVPAPGPVLPPPSGSTGLQAVNTDDADTLVRRFGLLPITVALLVARRPFQQLEDIRGILGLTDQQYAAIAAFRPTS